MIRVWFAIACLFSATAAAAQSRTFIQVEAQPTLAEGVAAAERYAGALADVGGFRLGGSWYAVVLGPFAPGEARGELDRLRFTGAIPRDAYLTTRGDYGARFFPRDGDATAAAPPVTQTATATAPADTLADETPAEARRSERLLTRDERAEIQTALADAGVYRGAIDASFGRGTRNAMAEWQAAQGFVATGVLTTAQRTALITDYRALLEGLGMERVVDGAAGIEIVLPTAVVARAGAESPFVRYEPTGDLAARVLLISQPGDRAALAALYDIMQSLTIVPVEGARTRRPASFDLEGRNDEIVSTTRAELVDGAIKGFTLIWPAGDERRRSRVLDEMRASFRALPGVLPVDGGTAAPSPDLVAGLRVRRPERDRSGFFVTSAGSVLTTSEAVRACERVTLDESVEADVSAADEGLGLALLTPRTSLAPIRYARFGAGGPPLRSEVAAAGYPFGGVLPAPSLNYGRVAETRGLDGDGARARLEMAVEPGETGGPVFDSAGAVVGILLSDEAVGARRMPDGVSFAAPAGPIADFLTAAGLDAEQSDGGEAVPPAQLTRLAADMTVLVRCWN